MPASKALAGVGTLFKRGNGLSPEDFTEFAEVVNIKGPTMTKEFTEVTHLGSIGGYKEFIAGFREGGEITLTCNYTPAAFHQFFDDWEDDDSHNYEIVLPDTNATTLDFAAFVMNCPLSSTKELITIDVTLRITGVVERTS